MEPSRFDRWSRQLGAVGSRRGIVRAVVAAVAIGVTGGTTGTDAAPRRRVVCRNPGVQCTSHGQCCTGNCRRISSSSRSPRYQCACPEPLRNCGGTCVDLMTDPRNCGRCGNVCMFGVCEEGVCFEPCKTLSPASNHCVFTNEGSESYPCYIKDEYQSGGITCTADADCQAGCPDGYDCVCSQYVESKLTDVTGGIAKPATCLAINQPVDGSCCYPEAEQEIASNSFWYCVVGVDGDDYQLSNAIEPAVDANDDPLTCTTDGDCSASDDCQNLSDPVICVCGKAFNEGDGKVDGLIVAVTTPTCYVVDQSP
jgi:hypothetical protein